MNDFTKEELQIILLDMDVYANDKRARILSEAKSHIELREKIRSMIDNYCEHPEVFRPHGHLLVQCVDCGHLKECQ